MSAKWYGNFLTGSGPVDEVQYLKQDFWYHKCHTYLCIWDPSWLVIGMNYAPSIFSWAGTMHGGAMFGRALRMWAHPVATLTMWVDRECMDLHGTHDLYFRFIKYVLAGLFVKKYEAYNYCTCNQVA
jgi:hypothetical protein